MKRVFFLLALLAPVSLYSDDGEKNSWEVEAYLGQIFQVGHNTIHHYHMPTGILSLRTPAHTKLRFGRGTMLSIKARLNFLGQGIYEAPESRHFGFSASPSLELENPNWDMTFRFAIGGGGGWFDARPRSAGMGRDYTYNWYMHGETVWNVGTKGRFSLGIYFQHNSNLGATDPNPGIDALGPMLGWSMPLGGT